MNPPTPPANSRMLPTIGAVTCVEFFENSLVTFSAARIMAGLALTPEQFAFAFTLYGVAAIIMLYKHQWVVERIGYRDFVLASLAVFSLGSVLCGSAGGVSQFALGRLLQGLGGATFFTAGRMAIETLAPAARFHGSLVFITSLMLGTALGPLLATLLSDGFGWRAVFFCLPPLSAAVALIAAPCLSRATVPPPERSGEHWGWLLWMALGVFGLQYAIQEVASAGSPSAAPTGPLALASIAILGLFAWRQWHRERPLIDYRGLFQRRYLLGMLFYFAGYFMLGAGGFLLPLFLELGVGLTPWMTMALVSAGLFMTLLAALSHLALARRWPKNRLFMLLGLTVYAGANVLFALQTFDDAAGAPWPALLAPILLGGAAMPFFLGSTAGGAFSDLPPAVFSHGYQVKNILRQLGLSSSVALATLALRLNYPRAGGAGGAHAIPHWEQVLHISGQGFSPALAAACGDVFLLLALLAVPVAMIVGAQKIFR
ncbi:MAG: MFS transporter [Burkholderiaceae bacterium]|nr:MFS transporter [Burkholderiaceae bacterium]